eukprot:682596-Rhodomonas_salina.1
MAVLHDARCTVKIIVLCARYAMPGTDMQRAAMMIRRSKDSDAVSGPAFVKQRRGVETDLKRT